MTAYDYAMGRKNESGTRKNLKKTTRLWHSTSSGN